MSITRLQQARQMYAMGQRVSRAFGGVMGMDGRRQYGGGSDAGKDGGYGYQGGGTNTAGVAGTGPASEGYGGGNTPSNDGPDNSPHIHTGPTYSPPTTVLEDEVALTGFGTVPDVDYRYVGPDSQFAKNTYLTNNFPDYSFNSKIPSINFIGNTLGKFAYNTNTNFFKKNNIGGKINPKTGEPFGYGIDGYKAYMEQRSLGNVGAYGGTELSQNAINARSGQDGIMDVAVNDTTDDGTDDGTDDTSDTTTDVDFFSRYLQNQPEDIRKEIEARMKNYYTV
jgi:hypothetical protein